MTLTRAPSGTSRRVVLTIAALLPILFWSVLPVAKQAYAQIDPLQSWNDGTSKRAIVEFVGKVTRQGGPDFVPPGERSLVELVMASHSGMSSEEFEKIVMDWLAAARHPRFNRPYTEMVYRPM